MIIEDGYNFNQLLEESLNTEESSDNICHISNEILTDDAISLNCSHRFNYLPLYHEVVKQKTGIRYLSNKQIHLWEIECPYCRTIQSGLLPYRNIPGIQKIKGVNFPKQYTMRANKCSICQTKCQDQFCPTHLKESLLCACKTNKGSRCKNKGVENIHYQNNDYNICRIHFKGYQKNEKQLLNIFKNNIIS